METETTSHGRGEGALWTLAALIALLAFVVFPPGLTRMVESPLTRPFQAVEGCVYRAEIPDGIPDDANGTVVNSRLTIRENGVDLGPPHAELSGIGEACRGSFAHLGGGLFFSSSDGSDPNVNGREYVWLQPRGLPLLVHLPAVMILQILVSFLFWRRVGRRNPIANTVCQVLLMLATIDVAMWTLVENDLASRGAQVRTTFEDVFKRGEALPEFRFAPHDVMNYALNSRFRREGALVHDPRYLVRRVEEIRPRSEVPWRILVVGGSTTYDNAVLDESDTWVSLLESRVRTTCGATAEVINGGVGGYTLFDNLVHYRTLLRSLEPDVVVMFVGINDVWPRLTGPVEPDYSNYRQPWRETTTTLSPPRSLASWSQAYRFYYLRHVIVEGLQRTIGAETIRSPLPRVAEWSSALAQNPPTVFRDLLDEFIRLAQTDGATVVVVPQHFVPITTRDESFAVGVTEHNSVARRLAVEHDIPFLDAVAADGAFSALDTVDNCHFTRRGARKMAGLVFDGLRERGVLGDCRARPRAHASEVRSSVGSL